MPSILLLFRLRTSPDDKKGTSHIPALLTGCLHLLLKVSREGRSSISIAAFPEMTVRMEQFLHPLYNNCFENVFRHPPFRQISFFGLLKLSGRFVV